jgi:hypothetical protein
MSAFPEPIPGYRSDPDVHRRLFRDSILHHDGSPRNVRIAKARSIDGAVWHALLAGNSRLAAPAPDLRVALRLSGLPEPPGQTTRNVSSVAPVRVPDESATSRRGPRLTPRRLVIPEVPDEHRTFPKTCTFGGPLHAHIDGCPSGDGCLWGRSKTDDSPVKW